MPQYKETAVTGTRYIRPRAYAINDPLGATAAVTVSWETVITLSDGTKTVEPAGNTVLTFQDGTIVLPLYNPATGDAIAGQSITTGNLYKGLYSLARYIAAQRGL